MTDRRLTDLTEITTPSQGDYLYIVDSSDTTDSPAGSSRKTQVASVLPVINVKSFGATGDGVTDDTTAIQAALTAQQNSQEGTTDGAGNTLGYNTPVYFPPGRYVTSSTLDWIAAYGWIIGDKAILSKAGSFTGTACIDNDPNAWRVIVEGLQFEDYDVAIDLDSNNVNSGTVQIRNCGFFNIAEDAIKLECTSSQATIEDCIWRSCKHEVNIVSCDVVHIKGGWISRGLLTADYDGGIVVGTVSNKAICKMESTVLVPTTQTVTEPAWFKNYGTVICRDVRFGGETGQHTCVNNYLEGTTNTQDPKFGVFLDGCELYFGSSQPAVRLFKIPNVVNITNNRGLTGSSATAIDWSSSVSDQSTQISTIGASVVRHRFYLRGNVLSLNVSSDLDFMTNKDDQVLLQSESESKLIFDRRDVAITAGEGYGQINWDGQDATANSNGTRAQIRTEAVSTDGGVKTVIANAAGGSTSLTDVVTVDEVGVQLALPLFITESAAAAADTAGDGQLWVKNNTPNTLHFTDDGGTDYAVAASSGTTGGTGSAGAGNQYIEITIEGTTYKVLHDGTV